MGDQGLYSSWLLVPGAQVWYAIPERKVVMKYWIRRCRAVRLRTVKAKITKDKAVAPPQMFTHSPNL